MVKKYTNLLVHQKQLFCAGVEIITLFDTYFLILRGMMSQQLCMFQLNMMILMLLVCLCNAS